MVRNLLVAVDGSQAAASALKWAADLVDHAHKDGQEIKAAAINIQKPAKEMAVDGVGVISPTVGAAQLIKEMVAHFGAVEDFEPIVATGPVAETILAAAHERHCDLIVVGTRRLGRDRQALMSSVSQALAAKGERPVAVVPAGSEPLGELTVVGYDGSAGARAAIRWALENCEGDLRIVRSVTDHDEQIIARESIIALLPALGADAVGRVIAEVAVGDPAVVLTDSDRKAPQLVLGARNEKAVGESLWGSVTTQILADTTRPVIVVPPEPWV